MKARCGREDCDCGRTIVDLEKALERVRDMTTDYLGTSKAAGDICVVAKDALKKSKEWAASAAKELQEWRAGETQCLSYCPACGEGTHH